MGWEKPSDLLVQVSLVCLSIQCDFPKRSFVMTMGFHQKASHSSAWYGMRRTIYFNRFHCKITQPPSSSPFSRFKPRPSFPIPPAFDHKLPRGQGRRRTAGFRGRRLRAGKGSAARARLDACERAFGSSTHERACRSLPLQRRREPPIRYDGWAPGCRAEEGGCRRNGGGGCVGVHGRPGICAGCGWLEGWRA